MCQAMAKSRGAPGGVLLAVTGWLVVLYVAVLPPPCIAQSGENFTQLLQDIIKVDSRVRPVRDAATPTTITVSFHLMSLNHFDTVEQKLVSNGWLQVMWHNEYTMWNPADYGNAYLVNPNPNLIWRPRLAVFNTMKDLKPIGEDYVVILTLYDGTTIWYPAERFETFCQVDVTYFPFDIQKCRWTMFNWGTDGNATDLLPLIPTIDLDSFSINGEWELRNTSAWREVRILESQAYHFLNYEVTLRRRPSLLALTVLLPVVVLAMVNVYVFTIPSEAGERLAYSMTALLSFGVFMSFILDSMPSSSETLSIVAVMLSCLLVMSALYVLLCILSLRLFYRDSNKHPVPALLQSLIVWLELLVCLDPPTRNNKVADIMHVHSVTSSMRRDGAGAESRLKSKLDQWAAARKTKHAVYADPKEMTWQRVSRTLDKLLFRFFFLMVIVANAVIWAFMIINYNQDS